MKGHKIGCLLLVRLKTELFHVFSFHAECLFFIRSVLLIFVPGIKFSPICVHNNCLCLRLKQKGLGKTFCTVLCELVHPWESITSCPGGGVVGIIMCSCSMFHVVGL